MDADQWFDDDYDFVVQGDTEADEIMIGYDVLMVYPAGYQAVNQVKSQKLAIYNMLK